MEKNCSHKRIKKNYPFGKKSKAIKSCKDCGEIITNKMIKDKRKERKNVKSKRISR